MTAGNPLAADLDHVLARTPAGVWDGLRGARVFVTGGTGFYGRWLLESFAWAADRLGLGARAVVLSRAPAAFARKAPHLAGRPDLELAAGDVRDFPFPAGRFTHVVHAATDTTAGPAGADPLGLFDTAALGTRRVLEFAGRAGAGRFLLASSGAVYGRQPPALTHVPEDYLGGPDPVDPRSAYAEGKRAAETAAVLAGARDGFAPVVARGFAFVGPFLPLAAHFAAGNFVRDGLAGGPIRVGGDGTPFRSYLYAADLAVWLWAMLVTGRPGRAYNVGSDAAVSIRELAEAAAGCFSPRPAVEVAREPAPGRPAERYVPAVDRARAELGLDVWVPLAEALRRTARWAEAAHPAGP